MKSPFEELITAKDEVKDALIKGLQVPQFHEHYQLFNYLKINIKTRNH